MYERFTDRARKVLALANQEAKRFNHSYIGTEHILIGLVKEGSGIGATVLKRLNVDLRRVRLEVEKIIQPGAAVSEGIGPTGRLPHTPRAKAIIACAIEEATALRVNHVGTEALLLGILRVPEGVAGRVLVSLGCSLETVRQTVRELLNPVTPLAAVETPPSKQFTAHLIDVPVSIAPLNTITYPEAVRRIVKPVREAESTGAEVSRAPVSGLHNSRIKLRAALVTLLSELDAVIAAESTESVQPDAISVLGKGTIT